MNGRPFGQRESIESNDRAHTLLGFITRESFDPVEDGSAALSLSDAAAKDILRRRSN